MAEFKGSKKDFFKCIGPWIDKCFDRVEKEQTGSVSGKCDKCGMERQLINTVAHEKDRRQFIEKDFIDEMNSEMYPNDEEYVDISLDLLESIIENFYLSQPENYHLLCPDCYFRYTGNKNHPLTLMSSNSQNIEEQILSEEEKNQIKLVKSKILKWFSGPDQNSKVLLIKYCEMFSNSIPQKVRIEEFREICKNFGKSYVDSYNRMKTPSVTNDRKVFVEDKNFGIVNLWDQIKDFVLKEYDKYRLNVKQIP